MGSELTSIRGIAGGTAKQLKEQDVETIDDLADADPENLDLSTGNAETLVQRANRQTITSKTAADLLDEYGETKWASTGVDELDEILGGGWEAETIGVTYGKSGKGKSQLLFSTLIESAAEGSVAYLQTELQSKSIAERLMNMAEARYDATELTEVMDNIKFYEAYDHEDQFDTYQKIREDHDELELLVIDSFTAQFRMTNDFGDRSTLSARSDEIGRHLKYLGKTAREMSIPIVMSGQVYPEPEAYGKGDKLWGGEKMKHFVSYFVRMSTGKGELVEAELENHPGKTEEDLLINIGDEGLEGINQ